MASAYPGGLDSFVTNLANATATANTHPTHHNDLADAVNKIEAELGVTPSGAAATVVGRLDAADTAVDDVEADIVTLQAEVAALQSAGLFYQPATIGAYDDYFDSDSSADWTAVAIAGTSNWNIGHQARLGINRGLLASFEEQAVGDWPAYLKPLTGIATGDYIQTSIGVLRYASGIAMPLLVFTDGATSAANVVAIGPEIAGDGASFFVTVEGTLANATAFDNAVAQIHGALWNTAVHWRLQWTAANTFVVFWSLNGEVWSQLVSITTSGLTPTHGGFVASSYGTGAPVHQALFKYFHSNVTP